MFIPAAGKQEGRRSLAAVCVGSSDKLFFSVHEVSGRHFLVDSGAQQSVMPASATDVLCHAHGPPLDAANGTPICTFGSRLVDLCFNGCSFSWDFVIASVSVTILGADFLCAFQLLVDVALAA